MSDQTVPLPSHLVKDTGQAITTTWPLATTDSGTLPYSYKSIRHFLPLDWEVGILTGYTAKDHK